MAARGKKGPTKGSGGKGRKRLAGRGPTPKAKDRTWHKNYRAPAPKKSGGAKKEAVAGRNPVLEALRAGVPATALYVAAKMDMDERIRDSLKIAADKGLPVLEASQAELDKLTQDARHQGIALAIKPYQYADGLEVMDKLMEDFNRGYRKAPPLVVMLDSITDPHNLGAIIRSSAAFNVDAVIIPTRRAASMTATAWKTSAGAAARVPVAQVTNLNNAITEYKKSGVFVIGLDGAGEVSLPEMELADEPLCVVVGSEGAGLSRLVEEHCDQIVSIPISSALESLNASMAVGITLYEVARKRASK